MVLKDLRMEVVKVTVIVPVYNDEYNIRKCLDSLVSQSLKDMEILVINDGSTDRTSEILERYSNDFTQIRVVTQKNHGLFETRKRALELAQGEYIGWVDSDDFVSPKMFEILYNAVLDNNSELSYCDYHFYPEKITTKEKWFREYSGKRNVDFIERNNQPWNKLVKKSLLLDLNIGELFPKCFDESYIKVLLNAKNPVSISKRLYYYRVGGVSMSTSYGNVAHYEKFVKSSVQLNEELKGNSDYWNQYFQYRIHYYILMTMLVAAKNDNKSVYEKYNKVLKKERFRENIHLNHILRNNFGLVKFLVIKYLLPSHFQIAKLLGKHSLG